MLWVWTPPEYTAARPPLPVLYLLDADVHYRHATALVHFLSRYLRAPQMIVVGVLNTTRVRDFTQAGDGIAATGRADRLLRFLPDEVRPYIKRTYNAAAFSILVGHSLGGLFAVHTAVDEPHAFSAYVAISPSLDRADSKALRSARSTLARRGDVPRFLFLAIAGNERPGIATATRELERALTVAELPGIS